MSGIFRSNSTSNHTNDSTPNKRFSFSAFCTSPGTLQDVTMENPYGVGYRSPCVSLQPYQGSTSPAAQGRSVREFEEQMATLRKENFNLKLRLYFIEESIPGYKQANSSSEDTLMKQLIDTKVEMEILRKEVQEKQDILKDAAQAMNQMEKIQKESETKYQHVVEDLNQKIQYMEMERDMDKSRINNSCTGGVAEFRDLMEHSDIEENLNALQKIHELEGLLKHSDDKLLDFQQQIYSLEELLVKRDETIKEYEEKVKELVFQNAELLETIENKDKEIANNERFLRGLRSKNADLKADNDKLMVAFKHTQDNFYKEMSNMQMYERQMRDQQDVLSRMQSTISLKTENTARLLERIQDYEKLVNKINIERNIVKRENRFIRTIISKLQANECYTLETQEIYRKYDKTNLEMNCKTCEPEQKTKRDFNSQQIQANKREKSARGSFKVEAAYKLNENLCVNICNNADCHFQTTTTSTNPSGCQNCSAIFNEAAACCSHDLTSFNCINDLAATSSLNVSDYLHNCCLDLNLNHHQYEPVIPIRYTISDGSLLDNNEDNNAGATSLKKSSSSFTSQMSPGFSSGLLCCNYDEVEGEFFLKNNEQNQDQQQRKPNFGKYSAMDGIRYVYSKFGKFP